MLRIVIALALVLGVALLAAFLADNPGAVSVDWLGYHLSAPMALIAVALVPVFAVLLLIWRLLAWLLGLPGRLGRLRREARERRGLLALVEGLAAIEEGDARKAQALARRSQALLKETPYARLLQARAAALAGDRARAMADYRAMLDHKETEMLALRGLIGECADLLGAEEVLALAERAVARQPKARWALEALFKAQTGLHRWAEAEKTLEKLTRLGFVQADEAAALRAALLTARAMAAEESGHDREALQLAAAATKLQPDLIAAAVLQIRLLGKAGKKAKAERLAEDFWARQPVRAVAEAYLALDADEGAAARLKRVRKLVKANPDQRESRRLLAEAALAAEEYDLARQQLELAGIGDAAAEKTLDGDFFRLMAELEERERGDALMARKWLMKAAEAPPPSRWRCRQCGSDYDDWRPLCDRCGALAGIVWPGHAPLAVAPVVAETATAEDAEQARVAQG